MSSVQLGDHFAPRCGFPVSFNPDIVVVGCGVAGATAAETAASLGSRVLVLEEHDRVGVPSHCSGHVGIKSMKRFASPFPHKIIKNEIRGATFHSPSGQILQLERRSPITWVLDRRAFDGHLAAKVQDAGAHIQLNSRATSMQVLERGKLQLQVAARGEYRKVDCKLVVDSEGAAPVLRPQDSSSECRRWMWVNSAQVHVDRAKDVDQEMVEVYFGSAYAPGLFAWIIPWKDGTAKVGLAAREGNARLLLEKFMTKHPIASQKLAGSSSCDVSFHPMPLGGPISKTFRDRMLIVGDSAQQVKPTTGGGIVFGLICGRVAGEVAHEACTLGDTSESYLSRYEKRWKSMIGRDLNIMRRMRRMLFRLPDRRLEKIFSIARSLDAATVLNRADDIDMQGRTLAKLAVDPRLLVTLICSSVLALPILTDHSRGLLEG